MASSRLRHASLTVLATTAAMTLVHPVTNLAKRVGGEASYYGAEILQFIGIEPLRSWGRDLEKAFRRSQPSTNTHDPS